MRLPANTAAEKALLSAILHDPHALDEIDISPDMFSYERHAKIFQAMRDGHTDIVSIHNATQIPPSNLTAIMGENFTSANIEKYAGIVREKFIRRELIKSCSMAMQAAGDETSDIDESLAEFQKNIQIADSTKIYTMQELAKDRWEDETGIQGVKTGFKDIDRILTCLKNGELVILAGRTSIGKTTLGLDIALNAARRKKSVLIFSLEMSAPRIADRLICAHGMIPGQAYRQRDYDRDKVEEAISGVYDLPILVYDKRVSTAEIRSKCMRVKAKHGLDLVLIDFITLVKDKREGKMSTADHVGEVAKRLQEVAKEINVPFVVMSQMNRNVEGRQDKIPMLSDLRDSGNIEEAADVVMFVHRPDYYGLEGEPMVIIAKNRDGPVGREELTYHNSIPTFRDRESAPF